MEKTEVAVIRLSSEQQEALRAYGQFVYTTDARSGLIEGEVVNAENWNGELVLCTVTAVQKIGLALEQFILTDQKKMPAVEPATLTQLMGDGWEELLAKLPSDTFVLLWHMPQGELLLSQKGLGIGMSGLFSFRTPEEVLEMLQDNNGDPNMKERNLVDLILKQVRAFDRTKAW
jgi:hypothetical protein